MPVTTIILDNIRSAHNVGSILRTADAFKVDRVISCGITPYLQRQNDQRLPHIAAKADQMIRKTALGAEQTVQNTHYASTLDALQQAIASNEQLIAIEQTSDAKVLINAPIPQSDTALVFGSEVAGISKEVLELINERVEIPMKGIKESLNVSVSVGIALYHYCSV